MEFQMESKEVFLKISLEQFLQQFISGERVFETIHETLGRILKEILEEFLKINMEDFLSNPWKVSWKNTLKKIFGRKKSLKISYKELTGEMLEKISRGIFETFGRNSGEISKNNHGGIS